VIKSQTAREVCMDYIYDDGIIKRSYRKADVDALPKSQRIDIIHRINPDSDTDMGILKSWIKHFQACGTPYVVKSYETILPSGGPAKQLILWKERRV